MSRERRRQMLRDYKERRPTPGVFAVRCTATGQVWVQASRNLEQQQNGVWFGLRLGSHPNRELQAAWTAHGEPAFAFDILERIDDQDLEPYVLDTRLKARTAFHRTALGAKPVAG